MYIELCLLLINQCVLAQVIVPNVSWYKERLLQKVTLGSLLYIMLLRTAHHNLAKLKVIPLTPTAAIIGNL